MKKLILAAALTLSSFAFASTWEIDTAHAAANFAIKHMTVSTVNGTFGDVTGKVEVDDKDVTKSKVEATIDVKAVNTKQAKRDEHLRGKDFFEVEKFPTATFKSTKIEKGEGNKLKVTGDLTIKGITKSVVLDGELSAEAANPFTKAKTRGFSATTTIARKDYGLTFNAPLETGGLLIGEDVKVSIEAELVKKEAAAPAAPAKK
ncbi:MAG: YceI family protein [Myxococcota bacterium]